MTARALACPAGLLSQVVLLDVLMCPGRAGTALCAANSTSIAATQRLTADSAIAGAVLGPSDRSSSPPVTVCQ
jgi:hypothetical protein